MDQFQNPMAAAVDPAGTVTAEIPCRRCGYMLMGLNLNGRCPECGTPVGVSVQGDLLRFSEPSWVQTLAKGASLTLWGIVAAILGGIAGVVLGAAGAAWLAPIIALLAGLVSVYGAWLLTEPDPSRLGEDQYGTSRKLIRVALTVGLVQDLLSLGLSRAALPQSLALSLAGVGMLVGLIRVAGQFAMLRYLQKLTLRIPDLQLSSRANLLFWGYGGTLAFTVVLGSVAAIYAAKAKPGTPPTGLALGILAPLGCAVGLAFLIFGVMYIGMLSRLKKAFNEQAYLAATSWAATPAAVVPPPMPSV